MSNENGKIETPSLHDPSIKSIDYDTCRVYFPPSDKYVTFQVHNLTDAFLQSDRTLEAAQEHGIRVLPLESYDQMVTPDDHNTMDLDPTPTTIVEIAKSYGLEELEYLEGQELAYRALLEAFQKRAAKE